MTELIGFFGRESVGAIKKGIHDGELAWENRPHVIRTRVADDIRKFRQRCPAGKNTKWSLRLR